MIRFRFIFAVFVFFCLTVAPGAYGADLLSKFHPYISISEEFNDNLNLSSTNKKDDFITTVQPGLKFSNMDKTSGIDLDYNLGLVFYSKESQRNYISHNASLNAKYMTAEHINFYLKESFTRSDEPRERESFSTTEDNRYVLATETQRAVYWRNVVAPTIEYQFGPENRLGVNYRNNLYQTESTGAENSQENYVNPFFSYWFDRQNGIYLEYGYTRGDFDKSPDFNGHRANARYTNRFSAKSSAFAEHTYTNRSYTTSSLDYDVNEPSVGLTFALTPTLTASAQVGYFWKEPKTGARKDGVSYKGEIANVDPRTSYRLSLQGGYTEDVFTSENLGFNRYHRATAFVTHKLERRLSVGCNGSVERAEFENPDRSDTILGIGANVSYMPLKWLTLSLEASHRNRDSNVNTFDYTENRGIFRITATY
jgi:hypothetical protein